MEERFYGASRWLVALTVVFIPLSIFILISGSWGANFGHSQWTRYILFVSWLLLTISLITGVSNLINPPLPGSEEEEGEPASVGKSEAVTTEEDEEEGESTAEKKERRGINVGYALLLAQASTFLLGIILYVIFISWMILPEIPLTAY